MVDKNFQIGNVVYYELQDVLNIKKNKKQILPNFPTITELKQLNFNSSDIVKIIIREDKTYKQFIIPTQFKIYNNIPVFIPMQNNSLFLSIINNEITWNANKQLCFFYISKEEPALRINKIMHDESLIVDIKRNKLGVKNAIPKIPDSNATYILISDKGQIKWSKIQSEGENL